MIRRAISNASERFAVPLPVSPMYSSLKTMSRRLKKSRPLRPTGIISADFAPCSFRKACAALMTFALNAPARPLSALTRTTRYFSSPRASSSGCENSSATFALRPPSTSDIFWANGRAAITRSCARLSFAAATIFIALVICCVFFTDLIRRRMSNKLAITIHRNLRFHKMYHRVAWQYSDIGVDHFVADSFEHFACPARTRVVPLPLRRGEDVVGNERRSRYCGEGLKQLSYRHKRLASRH